VSVDYEDVDDVPFETRIIYPSGRRGYESAIQECAQDLYEEMMDQVHHDKSQRQQEWQCDCARGQTLLLPKEWLRSPRLMSLHAIAADALVLPGVMALGPSATVKSVKSHVKMLLVKGEESLTPEVEDSLDEIMDSLYAILITREQLEDLIYAPDQVRHMDLPGLLENGEKQYDNCWWDNVVKHHVLGVLQVDPDMCRGTLSGIAGLAGVLHQISQGHEVNMLEALIDRWKSHPLALSVALRKLSRMSSANHTRMQVVMTFKRVCPNTMVGMKLFVEQKSSMTCRKHRSRILVCVVYACVKLSMSVIHPI
jgi:hypothetical protein